jgi:hypothetical protein
LKLIRSAALVLSKGRADWAELPTRFRPTWDNSISLRKEVPCVFESSTTR